MRSSENMTEITGTYDVRLSLFRLAAAGKKLKHDEADYGYQMESDHQNIVAEGTDEHRMQGDLGECRVNPDDVAPRRARPQSDRGDEIDHGEMHGGELPGRRHGLERHAMDGDDAEDDRPLAEPDDHHDDAERAGVDLDH